MARHRSFDAPLEAGYTVRGRIYVSSRTLKARNGELATEEGSIYGHYVRLLNQLVGAKQQRLRDRETKASGRPRIGWRFCACLSKASASLGHACEHLGDDVG